jgi:hypothetical protein
MIPIQKSPKMWLITDGHFFDLWNFAVEVVNGQHFLACLGVREYWWLFVWELALLLGVRGYLCFLKISGSVHGPIWVSCLNIDLAFVGCSCGDWLNFWVFVDDRVFYKYPKTFDGFASRSREPILVSQCSEIFCVGFAGYKNFLECSLL